MSIDKCIDCSIVLCKDCSSIHNVEPKNRNHAIQPIGYILNTKFKVADKVLCIRDIKCLPNGLIVATTADYEKVIVFFADGRQKHCLSVDGSPVRIFVVDSNTILVSLYTKCAAFSVAKVDIRQRHALQYVNNYHQDWNCLSPFFYTENQLYVARKSNIIVMNMSGIEDRIIFPGFTPYDMCYDVESERIYCIDTCYRKLFCIDKSGKKIFTFIDRNMKNAHSLTIDKLGNILVPCTNGDGYPGCVTKVDSQDQSSKIVIPNIYMLTDKSHSCFDLLTNSMIIGVEDMIYVYKSDA